VVRDSISRPEASSRYFLGIQNQRPDIVSTPIKSKDSMTRQSRDAVVIHHGVGRDQAEGDVVSNAMLSYAQATSASSRELGLGSRP